MGLDISMHGEKAYEYTERVNQKEMQSISNRLHLFLRTGQYTPSITGNILTVLIYQRFFKYIDCFFQYINVSTQDIDLPTNSDITKLKNTRV